MPIIALIADKSIKPKEKTEQLSQWISNGNVSIAQLLETAANSKDAVKATCIEALEYATKSAPKIGTEAIFDFACHSLKEKAPRIKWESAKVIGNIAHLYPDKLEQVVGNLLDNAEHEGTVVRWSAAFALGEILKMKTAINKDLITVVEAICEREEKNSIRKIYLAALKKVGV